MKWGRNRQSDQVEDRRSQPGGGGLPTGGGRRVGGKGIGLGTIVIALVAGWIFGINPMTILGALGGGDFSPLPQTQTAPAPTRQPTDDMGQFVAAVLGGTEDVWSEIFRQGGSEYRKPRLVLFRGATPTACGTGQSAMGPFYCPGDEKVYIDLSFYDTLRRELGAPGDFAQAYVIAHEVGHHVQNLLGITDKMEQSYWKQIGVTPKGTPWHVSAGLGMGEVLTMAGEMQGYTLSDRATYAAYKAKTGLEISMQGDPRMFNPYGIMAVNPKKYPDINFAGAMALIEWMTGAEGRAAIAAFKPSGEQLFFITPAK